MPVSEACRPVRRGVFLVLLAVPVTAAAQRPDASNAGLNETDRVQARVVVTPQVDSYAVRLLEAANARLAHAWTLRARVEQVYSSLLSGSTSSAVEFVQFARSGAARTERIISARDGRQEPTHVVTIATRTGKWDYTDPGDTVEHSRRNDESYVVELSAPVRAFFAPGTFGGRNFPTPDAGEWRGTWLTHPLFEGVRYLGQQKWQGDTYYVIEWRYGRSAELPEQQDVYTSRAYIKTSDTLVRRVVTLQTTAGWPERLFETRIADLMLDSVIDTGRLAPPPGRPVKEQISQARPASSYVGQPWLPLSAPAQLLDGPRVSTVDDLMVGKKAVVLWAWSTGCSPCNEEFPWMEALRREYDSLGVAVVGVNAGEDDEVANSRRYLAYHRAEMPVLFSAKEWAEPMYDSNSFTFTVVDSAGVVRYAGGPDLEAIKRTVAHLLVESHATRKRP